MGTPANLLPFIGQIAVGLLPELQIFGDNCGTHDGTGVRDCIHVMDLVEGHLAAIKAIAGSAHGKLLVANLGTGQGISLLQMVGAFGAYTGQTVLYRTAARRSGDVTSCFADARYAREVLGGSQSVDCGRCARILGGGNARSPLQPNHPLKAKTEAESSVNWFTGRAVVGPLFAT